MITNMTHKTPLGPTARLFFAIPAAVLMLLPLIVKADTTETWHFMNPADYDIVQPDLIEVVPTSPPDLPTGYAQLILQAQAIQRSLLTNYWQGTALNDLQLGADTSLCLQGSPGAYNAVGFFESKTYVKGSGDAWAILKARFSNASFDNSLAEIEPALAELVALYHGNGNWLDSSPNGMNLVYSGGTAQYSPTAKFGSHSGSFGTGCAYQDGTSLGLTDAITISLWVKSSDPDAFPIRQPISIGVGSVNWLTVRLGGTVSPSGSMAMLGLQSFSVPGVYTTAGDANIWRHIVAVYDTKASPYVRMYKDAVPVDVVNQPKVYDLSSVNKIVIGGFMTLSSSWSGLIDEVAIFRRSLTYDEVQKLYVRNALKFQVRSGNSLPLMSSFVGPDGTTNSSYNGVGDLLLSHTNDFHSADQYMQYRAALLSDAYRNHTPYLESVTIAASNSIAWFDSTLGDFWAGLWFDVTNMPIISDQPFLGVIKQSNGGYYTNAVYTSRVLDGGSTNVDWSKVSWNTGEELNAGTLGLIGLWRTENNWNAAIGQHGVPTDASYTGFAKLGKYSAVFNGLTTEVAIPVNTEIRSVEFWIKSDSINDGVMTINRVSGGSLLLTIKDRALLVTEPTDSPVQIFVNGKASSVRLLPGWNHVALVFGDVVSVTTMTIGTVAGDYLNGFLDELALYNRAIASAEIESHYITGCRMVAGSAKSAQTRSGNTLSELETRSFAKPGGTPAEYLQNGELFNVVNQRYFQYRIFLNSDGISTPGIRSITVNSSLADPFVDDSALEIAPYTHDGGRSLWYGDQMKIYDLEARGPINISAVNVSKTEGLWHFDEILWNGTASEVRDQKELRHGIAFGDAHTLLCPKVGTCCGSFNGTGAYVRLPGIDLSSGDFTICTWFKTFETNKAPVISTDDGSGECYTIEINGNGAGGLAVGHAAFRIEGSSNVAAIVSQKEGLNNGEWHNLIAIRGGLHVYLYIDGRLENVASIGAGFGNVDEKDSYVGTDGSYSVFFKGEVDEVGIWSRVLTASEIAEFSSAGYKVQGTGTYESDTLDAGDQAIWQEISWVPDAPYGKPLSGDDPTMTGLWRMEDNPAGSTITNSVGIDNGIINGATFNASGRFGQCLNFNAAGANYVSITDGAALEPASGIITVEAWVNLDDIRSCTVLDKRAGGQGYRLSLTAAGVPEFQVGGTTISSFDSIQTGRWTHVSGSYDASVGLKLYVNGDIAAVSSAGGEIVASTANAWIGSDVGGGNYLDGRIDEIAIHDRILNTEEIFDHYRVGAVTLKFQAKSSASNPDVPGLFVGPGASAGEYFTEFSGDNMQGDIALGRYFRFKAYLATEDLRLTPRLCGVRVYVANFSANNPTVAPTEAAGAAFPGRLVSFGDSRAPREPGDTTTTVRYQISGDTNSSPRWFYWDTSG
ncbi:MAG: hypothetical protein JXN60_00535, partial [Lentisphaerae bacterium]|nr:hypothetical protein [Lentisphaerota bacterium]